MFHKIDHKMSSSAICPKFSQNAWRKDLCSNCFKSKEEHKANNSKRTINAQKKTELAKIKEPPARGIMKSSIVLKTKKFKVNFPKNLTQIIGYGGEWSDADDTDDEDNFELSSNGDDNDSTDDEESLELKRLTKSNTEFNTNNGNLLGDPEENIKKSFAALRLGAPQLGSDGKKQTLKINVTPFGTPSKLSSMKAKFELNKVENQLKLNSPLITKRDSVCPKKETTPQKTAPTVVSATVKQNIPINKEENADGKSSPPIERAMEKSLLEEISETLEKKQKESLQTAATKTKIHSGKDGKIKFEISSLTESKAASGEIKKTIARNTPITKDHVKPKINISNKYPTTADSSDSNMSDNENIVSAYYDVVETNGYENSPEDKGKDEPDNGITKSIKIDDKSVYSSSQYITDMLLSSRTKAASYSVHEGSFMTSKITSDGLIVTKCASDDALDSTGSSFDGSSDEETSYNMNRSESDSGIGISLTNDYKNNEIKEKKLSVSTNNSDYEDIQVVEESEKSDKNQGQLFSVEKSRELAGEPDGSADPDGDNVVEAPALPKSSPPLNSSVKTKIDPRSSFLHGIQKNIVASKKPEVPAKPTVNIMKSFTKRQPSLAEQQVVSQLQQVIKEEKNTLTRKEGADYTKLLKKGRAPNPPNNDQSPPPTPEKDYIDLKIMPDIKVFSKSQTFEEKQENVDMEEKTSSVTVNLSKNTNGQQKQQQDDNHSTIYTRNPTAQILNNIKSSSPVIREKDKRERATVNPKFRSLNTFTQRKQQQAIMSTMAATSPNLLKSSADQRSKLSMSEECLAASCDGEKIKKKTKFSIKRFLRMGTSKTTDNLHKKEGIYSEIVTGEETGVVGKPRLVIIHPIDINTTAVEVVKDISKTGNKDVNNSVTNKGGSTAEITTIVTGKPPAPPQRISNLDRNYDSNKPARPPPPKSAELRRKQKIGFIGSSTGGSVKSKSDNVYANLGEIRSAIAPRKPERTASMREREAQLELARKRNGCENSDSVSVCSSNGGSISNDQYSNIANLNQLSKEVQQPTTVMTAITTNTINIKPSVTENTDKETSDFSTFDRKKKKTDSESGSISSNNNFGTIGSSSGKSVASKLEIFEKNLLTESTKLKLNDGLKDSVRKINNTIDSYLKDKRDYETLLELNANSTNANDKNAPPQTPARTISNNNNPDLVVDLRRNYEMLTLNNSTNRHRSSFQDSQSVSGNSYTTRSEYGIGNNKHNFNCSFANIPRVVSASYYCGSEIGESEIYSPYSFYGSEAGGDVASDLHESIWGIASPIKSRGKTTNRLRMRKGRSVVHKNIEDNYSAVVVANHEALAQVLDQLQLTPVIPLPLRSLANAINLRFDDFSILDGGQAFVVGKRAFHSAIWNSAPVTLALSADCNQISGVSGELNQLSGGVSGVLNPITEFCDLVPSYHLPLMPNFEVRMMQSTISVLPRLQLDTLQSIGSILKNKSQLLDKHINNFRGSIPNLSGIQTNEKLSALRNVCSVQNLSTLNEESSEKVEDLITLPGMPSFDDVMCREVSFIMLQLVNGLKNLQAKAIEEMPLSLSNVILCKELENKDAQARLCVLHGLNSDEEEQMAPLCKCAQIALTDMLPATKITPILSQILIQERSESLSKAKAALEFVLWGPSDVQLNGSTKERELSLQRWLDLERATVLHGLVRAKVELTVYDECHLMFLVRSNAKIMNEAAKIVTNFKTDNES